MIDIEETLFDTYGISILKGLHRFPRQEVEELLNSLPIKESRRIDLYDRAMQLYWQWSADGFALGLHLGLSLLTNTPSRPANGGRLHGSTAPAAAKRKGSPYNNHHRR